MEHSTRPRRVPRRLMLGLLASLALWASGCADRPSTTRPVTSAVAGTEIPTSTPPRRAPTWDVLAEVRSAYDRRYRAYWDCLRSPADCDRSHVLPGSPAAGHLEVTLAELIARDRFVGPEPVGYHRVEDIALLPDGSAEVTACWWSTAVLYGAPIRPEEPAGPTNPHTVVSSTPEGGRQLDRFVRTSQGWVLSRVEALDSGSTQDPCGGEP